MSDVSFEDSPSPCPRCGWRMPTFPNLSREDEQRVRQLVREGETVTAMAELREAAGCSIAVAKAWALHVERPVREPAPLRELELSACPECGAQMGRGTTACFGAGCSYRVPPGHFAGGGEP